MKKQSYRQPPILNAKYNTEQEMENILNAPSMTPDEKSTLCSNDIIDFKHLKIIYKANFKVLTIS